MNPIRLIDEDEDQQRRHVREPAADRLRRQALLGDLHLRDLVDRLADRLPAVERLAAHQDEAEQDRQDGAEHQVDDRLRDREVERAEVDRDPLVLLELGRRVELAAREGRRGQRRGRASSRRAARASCPRLLGVVAEQREAELGGVGGAVDERGGQAGVLVGRDEREQHREDDEQPRTSSRRRARPRRRRCRAKASRARAAGRAPARRPRAAPRRPSPSSGQPATRKSGRASAITSAPASRREPALPLRIRPRRSEDPDAGQKASL